MGDLQITHIFTFYESLGGVQSILKHHYTHDSEWGIVSQFHSVFEQTTSDPTRLLAFKQTALSNIRSTRRIFKQITCQTPPRTLVYHNLWGLPILADLDQSKRRVGVIHSDWPTLEFELNAAMQLLDGILCVSHPLVNRVLETGLHFDSDRITFLPYPITRPISFENPKPRQPDPPLPSKPLVLGFCGRLVKVQKRIDRLVSVCNALDHLRIPFQLEILGHGVDERFLKAQLLPRTNVVFHGFQQGEAYWRILANWDAILFVSDYEGLPISLLEAMSLGVPPIYPRIHSGGDDYAKRVAEKLLFDTAPSSFATNAARSIQWLASRPITFRHVLSSRAIEITQPHSLENYFRVFSDTLRRVEQKPRLSISRFKPRPHYWSDHIPYALLDKCGREHFFRKPIPLAPA